MNRIICTFPAVTKVLSVLMDYAGIDDVTVAVVMEPKLLAQISGPDMTLHAALWPTAATRSYRLVLSDPCPEKHVLCHEMVHLTQFISGRLVLQDNGYVWCGVHYPADLKYDKRPWEIEAFAEQREFYQAYRKSRK